MKKIRVSLIAVSIILMLMLLTNMVYAANTMDLNITDTRPYTNSKFTVTIGEDGIQKDAVVFKVLRKDGGRFVTDDKFALYCLRSGLGFGDVDLVGLNGLADVTYTELGDLKQDVNSIISYYKDVIGYTGIDTDNSYNAILWIIDNMYLPENPDMDKDKFLAKAGLEGATLTEDEIEAIQQVALWYFSNYDKNGEPYSLSLADSVSLGVILKKDDTSYSKARDIEQINMLYDYFITNAKANAAQYGNGNIRELNAGVKRVEIDKTKQLQITKDANGDYLIGPVNIKKTNATNDFDLEIKIKDAQGNVIPEKDELNGNIPILYSDKDVPLKIEELVNNGDVYIKIVSMWDEKFDFSSVSIETITTYFETKASLWVADADEQPIVKIEKEKKTDTDKITTERITGKIELIVNKVDKDNKLLLGANFKIVDETNGRNQLVVIDNGDGTFGIAPIEINTEGQTFILDIEETVVPAGYAGIKGSFKIKITTKLSDDKTKYIIDKVELVDSTGKQVVIPGVKINFVADTGVITLIVENSKNKEFDLALRKYITKINGKELTGADDRTPKVDVSNLNNFDATTQGKITTAKYTHSKTPLVVKQGDIVTYKIRVYNEGELDGYATEIADYIPEGLGYLMNYKTNTDNLWHAVVDGNNQTMKLVGEDGLYKNEADVTNLKISDFLNEASLSDVQILKGKAKIYSTALADSKIKAYDPDTKAADVEAGDTWQQSTNGTSGLYYREVEVTCVVLAENSYEGILRNIAEVQKDKAVDEDGNVVNVSDRDSKPDNVDIDNYNPPADNSSYQQDDDDYEPLMLRHFDLALRKFITAVNDDAVTTRIPQPKKDENGKLKYEHDKTPVYVANSDFVTYTIRVYNEGTVLGYATEISDDIPDGLVFVPANATNKEYGWKMYDITGQETTNVSEAVEIRTKYLENTRLNPYDSTKEISTTDPLNPDWAEVKVVFQVMEKNITSPDRIITNKAQITEDKAVDENDNELDIDDDDSIPNEWNEREDDQDIEKVYVKKFDLALLKWVTQTIVTVDGQTVTTDTGFTPYDDPKPIAAVEIQEKKINQTTVKFVYNIMIINQGEIPGYATEITDYIPAGLAFVQEDNPQWTKVDDNKITTRVLEETLLQPGESATIEVVFTWINGRENMGTKTNIAEISEDYNEYDSPDVDSIPDNVNPDGYDKQQEDDDDKALVVLILKLGGETSYVWLVVVVLTIITGGIILIKKYVLE